MLLTEVEARGKWCPFARMTHYNPSTPASPSETIYLGNRDGSGQDMGPGVRCISSACMAWRWGSRGRPEGVSETGSRLPAEPPRGWCGLAGDCGVAVNRSAP